MGMAHENTGRLQRPTPLIGDILFSEIVDTALLKNQNPTYGDPHPLSGRWPYHKLVFCEPLADDKKERWYYAADRDSQDLYNFAFTKADIGQTKFDSVTRTYIRPRSSFAPAAPVMGTAMPNVPENLFTGGYVLANHREIRIEQQELDSLYVAEEMTWVKRVSISEVTLDTQTGNSKRAITTLYYKGEDVPGHGVIEALAADPTLAFWGLQPTGVFRELQQLSDNWFAVTESTMFGSLTPYSSDNPAKQRVFERVTPVSDLIFYEVGLMPDPITAIGTAHYSLTDFQLLFIEPADKTGVLYTFYYAKARSDESSYNYVLNEGGLTLTRTHVALRASVPSAPEVGDADSAFVNYKYATRDIKRFGELRYDMRFVIVEDLYSLQDQDIQLSVDRRPGYRVIGKSKFLPTALNPSSPGDAKSSSFSERGWQTSEETAQIVEESIGTGFEQKPFVKISTSSNASATPELPVVGSGSSKLVWLNEDLKVFQNEVTTSEAVEGPAGQDKEIRPFVQIDTDKRYSEENTINTTQGNARVVYNDGMTLVYEIGEVTSTGRYGPAGQEQQRKAFVTTKSDKSYSASPDIPGNKNASSRKIYDDGTTVVYEHSIDTNTANPGPAGTEKDEQVFVSKNTDKQYSTSPNVSTPTGSSRVVFNDGTVQVYEVGNITSTGKYGDAGTEERSNAFVKITTNKEYAADGSIAGVGSSRKVYDDGSTVVYEKGIETAEARTGPAGNTKDARVGYILQADKTYSTSPDVTAPTGSSRVAFNDGTVQVYEVDNITPTAAPTSFVGGKNVAPLYEETTTTEYKTSPEGTGIYQSGVSYTDGALTVYKVDSTVTEPGASRTYATLINDRVPSVLKTLEVEMVPKKDGSNQATVEVEIEEGYQGSFEGKITEYFSKNPNAAAGFTPTQFRPKGIVYQGFNVNFTIPPTLHGGMSFTENTGTEDPIFEYVTKTKIINPTTPVDIPTGFVPYAIDVQPFKDGYIIREIQIKYK